MGGLLSGFFQKHQGKIAPQGPDPEMVKAQKEQEARLEAREAQSQRELAARKRARRSGGNRALMSQRDNPFLGVPTQTTLGPSPFSRNQSGTNY